MSERVIHGDSLAVLPTLAAESMDAVVTDPPAGISFMGKSWDGDKGGRRQWVAWMTEVFTEVHRVLKPGAHGFVWALPRTSHWSAWALEDAGFEIRDCVYHLFGSGFPKSLDVSKAIDKAAGAERMVVGPKLSPNGTPHAALHGERSGRTGGGIMGEPYAVSPLSEMLTAPATPAAECWQGWGTALKPAAECWWLIRKPLSERTVAANVLAHGTGALNIDAARIGPAEDLTRHNGAQMNNGYAGGDWKEGVYGSTTGRWPANVAFSHDSTCREIGTKRVKGSDKPGSNLAVKPPDGYGGWNQRLPAQWYSDPDGLETVTAWDCAESCAVRLLDAQSGETTGVRPSDISRHAKSIGGNGTYGGGKAVETSRHMDTGGASRFFYTAKASTAERGAYNDHPTVKPLALMTWLVKLVTPPGGVVLDPFCGSGSTLLAASRLGFDAIGIDSDAHACEITRRRLEGDMPMFAEVTE